MVLYLYFAAITLNMFSATMTVNKIFVAKHIFNALKTYNMYTRGLYPDVGRGVKAPNYA
jgi:hypothetical protein